MFSFPFTFKQETLLDLQRKITKANCCMASEQMERILQAYLILVQHGNGSKISLPEDVCRVRSDHHFGRCARECGRGQLKQSCTFLMHQLIVLGFELSEQRHLF